MEPLEAELGVTAQFSIGRQQGFPAAPSPPPMMDSKKVLLRRTLQAVPSASDILDPEEAAGMTGTSHGGTKKVLLAHRIKPGQAIKLKAQNATATIKEDGPADLSSESMIGQPPQGPRFDREGMLMSFSVLGPSEEFLAQQQRATLSARPIPGAPPQAPIAPSFGATAHPRLEALEAAEETARLKNDLSMQRQTMAATRGEQFRRNWAMQMRNLERETGIPADKLMMARTAEYRKAIQQREVLEALRRRQHPYGGNRAWQITLRESGIFYEAIGNAANGLFCPFKQPDDAAALARAGALAAQPGEVLSLAALEAKIIEERLAAMAAAEALGPDEEDAHAHGELETGAVDVTSAPEGADGDDDYIDPESFDVINEAHMAEIARLRDKYNIEGAAPAHLTGDERTLWGIFKEIDTDESGSVSKQELYAAFAKMGLVASAAEMLRLFREGDLDGNGRIDCDEFITLGKKVDVFSGAAAAFAAKHGNTSGPKRKQARIAMRKGDGRGPRLGIDVTRHVFLSSVGTPVEKTVTMTNHGSTALYYEWVRAPVSTGLGSTTSVDAAAQFFVPKATGVILPDTTLSVPFLFKPSKAGMFTEDWILHLTPPIAEPTPPVNLRGVGLKVVESELAVRTLEQTMDERKTWQACKDVVLRDVINGVFAITLPESDYPFPPKPPPKPPPPPAANTYAGTPEAENIARRAAAWSTFHKSYATPQKLPEPIARAAYDDLASLSLDPAVASMASERPVTVPEGIDPQLAALLCQIFEAIDTDGNRMLDAVELRAVFGAEQGDAQFAWLDANADAVVSEEEFVRQQMAAYPEDLYSVEEIAEELEELLARARAACAGKLWWSGDVLELEERLGSLGDAPLLQRLEAILHRAATTTPDLSRALRLRHAAAAQAQALGFEVNDEVARCRLLYGMPTVPLATTSAITRRGVPMSYCWETETYEPARDAAQIGAKARAERLAREREEHEAAEWEAAKAKMSKKDLKKALKKEAEEAVPKAAARAAADAEAAAARAAAEAAEAKRLADPAVQHEMAYAKAVEEAISAVVRSSLDAWVERAASIAKEPAL